MYYTVIKQDRHVGTLEKCRKQSPVALVFYISLVFSNARRVLSQGRIYAVSYHSALKLLVINKKRILSRVSHCDKRLAEWANWKELNGNSEPVGRQVN